jgi:uncharacterized surface protein with fasciclin (FAS1) repeats
MRIKNSLIIAMMMVAPFVISNAKAQDKDIVDIAAGNKDFSTLVTAVKAAGLVDTLKGTGPFTVFAPTNAAFKKVPPATLKKLLANKAALTKVLTYHVLSGNVMAADVMKIKTGTKIKTVEGSSFTLTKSKHGLMIDKARIIKTDIKASNGVIHVIDTVIIPKDLKL